MRRYLCISVTFLDPWFHGKVSKDEPEWPPSPYRLFQALLAGARTGCRNREWNTTVADAFRWLQRQEPPLIVAPRTRSGMKYVFYVPNNDSDKKPNRQDRLTTKKVCPSCLLDEYPLRYLWRIEERDWPSSRQHVELLCHQARHLLALGWGIDTAVGNGSVVDEQEAEQLPGQRWKPLTGYRFPDGSARRVPRKQGTLDDLESCHKSFLESVRKNGYYPPREPNIFDVVSYAQPTSLPPRRYVGFELGNLQEKWSPFPQEKTIHVAAMVRHQACEAAKRDSHSFPGGAEVYVAGHVGKQEETPLRFSYLPVPTIGHPYADGMIRRVLIAEPYGSDGAHVQWAKYRLPNRGLVDPKGETKAILLPVTRLGNVFRAYLDPWRDWFSVTPVILPGYDDGKYAKAQKLFVKAIEQAGYPLEAVEDVVLRKAPYWPGSEHPNVYERPAYLKNLPGWHVAIRFRDPIPGPVAIGAGRHIGLGVFAGRDYGSR